MSDDKGNALSEFIDQSNERQMCAWMPELWLEKNGIEEQDVPWLTFADTNDDECKARDIGALEGMPEDAHYWLCCSREENEAEREEHGDEEGGLAHYTCGTETSIHQGSVKKSFFCYKILQRRLNRFYDVALELNPTVLEVIQSILIFDP